MTALGVSIGTTRIGVLERFGDESEAFTFDERFTTSTMTARPVLGQLFEDRFPDPIVVGGPISWFANLLPQGAMRKWRARLYGIDEDDSFELLSILGSDLPGAVRMSPVEPLSPGSRGKRSPREASPVHDDRFRFSLAGNQWKLSARSHGRGLTTNADAEGIAYIAKFHSPEYPDLPQCEFATMNWANKCGIQTPEFAIKATDDFDELPDGMPVGDGKVFICKRFDRELERRIHIEDFAQILDRPPSHLYHGAYEEIARVLRWISPESVHEYLRVLIFNLLSGNGDAHLKNFSVLYRDGRVAVLTPAYDLVTTIVYVGQKKENLALKLFGEDRFPAITEDHILRLATEGGLDESASKTLLREVVERTVSTWELPDVREEFTSRHRERIDSHIQDMKHRILS